MKSRISSDSWLITRPIAHRGLHGNGAGENTRTAFGRAIENGYPIETDVRLTKDGRLVSLWNPLAFGIIRLSILYNKNKGGANV